MLGARVGPVEAVAVAPLRIFLAVGLVVSGVGSCPRLAAAVSWVVVGGRLVL